MSPVTPAATGKIIAALQCSDSGCSCRRNGAGKHTLHCPAHDDEHPSLSLTEQNGVLLVHCHAGCTQDVVIDALRKRGLWQGGIFPSVKGVTALPALQPSAGLTLQPSAGLTLQALADAKQLPVDELRGYGLADSKYLGAPAVKIPYTDTEGNVITIRYRRSLATEPRFAYRKGDKAQPYLQDLAGARKAGWALAVEGESDCWTCWHYGIPAIGIPGKSSWRSEWAGLLADLDLYIWQEPNAEDFALRIGADIPTARVIRAPDGIKDPSAAHILGHDVLALIARQRAEAVPVAVIRQAAAAAKLKDLAAAAAPVLAVADPLELIEDEVRARGYGGDIRPVNIVYWSLTSRVLEMRLGAMPVHTLLLGGPSSGKTYTVGMVLRLLPDEAFHTIDAGSPRALIYDHADLRHKVAVFSEADSLPAGEDNPAASAIRGLLQDNYLHYTVTVRDPQTGDFTVREILKPGPTVLLTTAVRRLGDQLMTRLFVIEMADDPAQVGAALRTQAAIELHGTKVPDAALVAFQAYLQARAPWDVIVPFADRLADAIAKTATAPRILRDFSRLLALIKSVAVLRHRHRTINAEGRLVAALADYETVRQAVADMYRGSVSDGGSDKVRAAVDAVRQLHNEKAQGETVTAKKVADRLGINKMAASRRLKTAILNGWVLDLEQRKGHPMNLEPGEAMPEVSGLPVLTDGSAVTSVTDGDAPPTTREPAREVLEL